MCIGVDEFLRHRKPCLKLPCLKICVRCLGGYGDSSPNLFGLRSLQFVSSRSCTAPQPSGKIDFPARRGSNRILSLIASVAWRTIRNSTKRIHNALVHGCARRLQIGYWQKFRAPAVPVAVGVGGHAQTQRQDRDFGPGRAARQSRASDRRSPSTNCREAEPKTPASSRWPRRDYEMERDWWWASHIVDPRHNHL